MDEMLHRSLYHSAFSFYHFDSFILPQKRLNYKNAFIPFQPEVEFRKIGDTDTFKGF